MYSERVIEKIHEIEPLIARCNVIIGRLEKYVDMFEIWSSTHNITSKHGDSFDIWGNVYDSIRQAGEIKDIIFERNMLDEEIVDAGSGGGFPGIPLSIIFASKKFILVDASRKKCSFLRLVKATLGLENVQILNKRLEDLEPRSLIITKAAFSVNHAFILAAAAKSRGKIVMWSTPKMASELSAVLLSYGVVLHRNLDYFTPDGRERSLLVFDKL